MEIAKRLNAIIAQLLPFLSQEVRKNKIYTFLLSVILFSNAIIIFFYHYSTNNKLSLLWKEQNKSRCQSLILLLGWVLFVLQLLYFRTLMFYANFNAYRKFSQIQCYNSLLVSKWKMRVHLNLQKSTHGACHAPMKGIILPLADLLGLEYIFSVTK